MGSLAVHETKGVVRMTDEKNVLTELEMIKKFHESVIDESTNLKEISIFKGCLVAINHAINLIENMEERIAIMSEGMPEVVRCKDCEHWDITTEECGNSDSVCFRNGWTKSDWFCADGERKTE